MKKYDVQKFELLSNEQIADGIFDMRVKNDELAPLAKCGQFAMFMCLQKLCADLFRFVTAKTVFSALFIR